MPTVKLFVSLDHNFNHFILLFIGNVICISHKWYEANLVFTAGTWCKRYYLQRYIL